MRNCRNLATARTPTSRIDPARSCGLQHSGCRSAPDAAPANEPLRAPCSSRASCSRSSRHIRATLPRVGERALARLVKLRASNGSRSGDVPTPSARAWNTTVGQLMGVVCGYLGVFCHGRIRPEFPDRASTGLAAGGCRGDCGAADRLLQPLFKATNTAGGATALVVALGAERPRWRARAPGRWNCTGDNAWGSVPPDHSPAGVIPSARMDPNVGRIMPV